MIGTEAAAMSRAIAKALRVGDAPDEFKQQVRREGQALLERNEPLSPETQRFVDRYQ